MLDWVQRRYGYEFRVVVYEHDETWVACAADAGVSGFGESEALARADLCKTLEQFVKGLEGRRFLAVKKPRKTDASLRALGELTTVSVPNPHPFLPMFAWLFRVLGWPSWLLRTKRARN